MFSFKGIFLQWKLHDLFSVGVALNIYIVTSGSCNVWLVLSKDSP